MARPTGSPKPSVSQRGCCGSRQCSIVAPTQSSPAPRPRPYRLADGFPILVCNAASLAHLNTRMPSPIGMERFRPNIVLEGLEPFEEDRISELRFDTVTLRLVKPCTRCVITSTDQLTGEPSTNPLPVLRAFRFDKALMGVTFGENAVIAHGVGQVLEAGCDVLGSARRLNALHALFRKASACFSATLVGARGSLNCARRTFDRHRIAPNFASRIFQGSVLQIALAICPTAPDARRDLKVLCRSHRSSSFSAPSSPFWAERWRFGFFGREPRGTSTGEAGSYYHALIEQSPNGVLIAEASTLRIVAANAALQRSLGYSLSELRSLTLGQLFSDESAEDDALLARLRSPDPRMPFAIRQRCKNGTLIDVEISGNRLASAGTPVLAFTTNDVTLRRKIEAQLLEKQQHLDHLAHHDQLTGLPNRLFLAVHLPEAIEEARRTGATLAVLFLDLDRFKHINDSRGHEVGDKLLKTVASRVRSTVRDEDVVVRMGGDEFIVVLKNVKGPHQVNETASRINEALSAPVIVDGRPLVTTVSIGVSMYPRDGTDIGELLRHSDTAMYQAKDRGRNNFQLFSPGMDRKLKERIAIESSLRAAIEQKQLDVHYQPIIDIETHRVMGLEALLRWKHPLHGFVAPGPVHRRGRGNRAHRSHRRFRARTGDERRCALARDGLDAGAGGREHLGRAASAHRSARDHSPPHVNCMA